MVFLPFQIKRTIKVFDVIAKIKNRSVNVTKVDLEKNPNPCFVRYV